MVFWVVARVLVERQLLVCSGWLLDRYTGIVRLLFWSPGWLLRYFKTVASVVKPLVWASAC